MNTIKNFISYLVSSFAPVQEKKQIIDYTFVSAILPYFLLEGKKYDSQTIDTSCPICLQHFEQWDSVFLMSCRHVFHKDCIMNWLKVHPRCPMCLRNFIKI